MIYGSVCSGIEAASVAWDPLGWERQFVAEVDKFANQVLRYHYPDTPNLHDFTTIEANERTTDIDVLVAGTPCQSFSVAGLRRGMDDPRGNLTLGYCRLLDRLRPTWFLWENVPGVLSSNDGRDFGAFLGAVEKLGYEWAYRILDAQYFGVPQRRRRVFVVGHSGDWRGPAAVLFERESLSGRAQESREERPVTTTAVTQGFGSGGPDDNDAQGRKLVPQYVTGPIPASAAGTSRIGNARNEASFLVPFRCQAFGKFTESDVASTHKERDNDGSSNDLVVFNARQDPDCRVDVTGPVDRDGHTQALAFNCKQDGGSASETAPTLRAMNHDESHANGGGQVAVCLKEAAIGRRSENGPQRGDARDEGKSYTLNTRERHAVTDGLSVRRLTPLEWERLQGFPDGYTATGIDGDGNEVEMSDTRRYKLLGNSFAVPVVKWIGERIELVESIRHAHETES